MRAFSPFAVLRGRFATDTNF